jgi:8-oxo-dGTP pyrophosphatase MutT (NUDIX family)
LGYTGAIDYVSRILACHNADLGAFEPWCVDGVVVGHVHAERVPTLLASAAAFERVGARLQLRGMDFASRSAALAGVVDALVAAGELRPALGELYPVAADLDGTPRLQVDRTAVTWFGVRARGVHLNGWVRRADGLHLWIAERSRGKRTYPGHLDNVVAGGSAIGLSPRETLVKECAEEAGIPAALAERAVGVGSIRYLQQDGRSLKPDHLDLFDLELPADFVPVPHDGEVERFTSMPAAAVAASLRGDGLWKPNCALVALDFLLRHGELDRELPGETRLDLWQRLRGARPGA